MKHPLYYIFPGIEIPVATRTGIKRSKRVNAELKFLPTRKEIEFIIHLVAAERGCDVKDIVGTARRFYVVTTRHIIMKILRQTFADRRRGVYYRVGMKTIGKMLGKRNHSTVINGVKAFNNLYDTEVEMRDSYHVIQRKVIDALKQRRKIQVVIH
jgi:chromosomal replication initiation ATPase DnaA